MSITLIGCCYVFGITKPKPIFNPPPGKIRFRMRDDEFVFAIVRNPQTGHCRWAAIVDSGDYWQLDFNISAPTGIKKLAQENRELRKRIAAYEKLFDL